MNEKISQKELDVLLGKQNEAVDLTAMEKDALGELANISLGAAATTLSTLVGKQTKITTPQIESITWQELEEQYADSYVIAEIDYKLGLKGKNIYILHQQDAGVLADLMMEGDGHNPPSDLDEMHLSAISEVTNQMMGSATTALAGMLKKRIEIEAPVVQVTNLVAENLFAENLADHLVKVAFDLTVEDLIDSETIQLIPISFARQMISELYQEKGLENEIASTSSPDFSVNTAVVAEKERPQVEIVTAQFPAFSDEIKKLNVCPASLDLIMDIGLQLSVELGKTKKQIREILELTNGSIVELDKLAGEPVDILINDKLLAKGEVVIIDENFGVRVTEIVSPEDRIKNLR